MPTAAPLSPEATAAALPYTALAREIAALMRDQSVQVPPRLVQTLAGGAILAAMPAHDANIAITKLITYVACNPTRGLPAIQGDIVVFDGRSGCKLATLDGPTVTARRTAAVSLLAAQRLRPQAHGPLLIVGAGVQGRSHLEAFQEGLGISEVLIASRSAASAQALAGHARRLGLRARTVDDANAAVADCAWIVSCTPAQEVVLSAHPGPGAFVAAVGAFTPSMVEWAPQVCQAIASTGQLVVDTRDADHEAGDLLQAGIDVSQVPTLAEVMAGPADQPARSGPVFFKSCGWAGWDLAAARCAQSLWVTQA
jgi:ornithine cyclodeaminase